MAFTGTPTVNRVGFHTVRLTNAVIAGGASASVGFFGDAGVDLQLPDGYLGNGVNEANLPTGISLSDRMEIHELETATGGASHVHMSETNNPWRLTFTVDTGQPVTLEIDIHYQHSMAW